MTHPPTPKRVATTKNFTAVAAALLLAPAAIFAQAPQPTPQPNSTGTASQPFSAESRTQILFKIRSLKSSLLKDSQKNDPQQDPAAIKQSQARTRIELAGWLLCLDDGDPGVRAQQSVAASREALAALTPDDSWRFRAQGLLVAGLLLSDPTPEKFGQGTVTPELARLITMMDADPYQYSRLWDGQEFAFAKEPGFKRNLKKAIDASQTSFLAAMCATPAPPDLPVIGVGIAHGWRFMPADTLAESSQNLQQARAAWTAVLATLPLNTPPQDREAYQIRAADCWLATPAATGASPDHLSRNHADLLVSLALMDQILNGDAPQARPLIAGRAANRLFVALASLIAAETNPAQKTMLLQRQVTACELALRVVPTGPGPGHELRVLAHKGLTDALLLLAQMPGQDKASLWRRGIAHYKAALVVHPGNEALALQNIWRTHLYMYRDTYKEMGLEKDVPFDDIKPAQ